MQTHTKSNAKHPGTYLFHKFSDGSTVKIYISEHATVTEQLEAFARFLRGVGYVFDGGLEIINNDEDLSNEI